MATHAADPMEQGPGTATTLERKRPHDVITSDDASSTGSARSNSRKRSRNAAKLGHQDVRDFVPVGASFSTSAVPIDETRGSGDDGSQKDLDVNTETLSGYKPYGEPEEIEKNQMLHQVSETTLPHDVQVAPPVKWNAVNTTKIRTTLGGSVGKFKVLANELTITNGDKKEIEGRSSRDAGQSAPFLVSTVIQSCKSTDLSTVATSVALERLNALRFRLSSMSPHDGPVSAYQVAKEELHNAEVDYNYCLYFPSDEAFQSPPLPAARKSTPKKDNSKEYRSRLRSIVEQCMKEGTLHDLKDGKICVGNAERLDQQSPAQMEQVDGEEEVQVLTATDPKQVQILGQFALKRTPPPQIQTSSNAMPPETQDTYRKQQSYLKALPNMKIGTHGYEKMKKRVLESEIHLNYCKYFPATEDYLPLVLAKKGLNELNSSKVDGLRAVERRAAQIWKMVEQCTQDGILQDLKDGRLAAWLKDVPPPNQSFFASALQAKHPQGITVPKSKLPFGGGPKEASNGDGGTSADKKPTSKEEGLPNDRQDTSESDKGVILNLDYGNQDMPSMSGDENIQLATKSETMEEEELLNTDEKDIKQQLPAINLADDDINASDSVMASNSDTEGSDSSMDSEGQSEDGDAMMQYSNSELIAANEGGRNSKPVAVPPSHTASVLADLSPHDLNAQLKYFHTTKAREDVDGKTPVRCLVCAKEGHMAGSCESLTCSTCGAFNRHTTQVCPNRVRCEKCREQGHNEGQCPYKLRKMPSYEIVCDLCQRNGHIENDCELSWRTSGRPWESNLAHANVRLSCYECGHSGHLGNDCPSRKPNKPMGTSTWDGNMGPVSIKSTREIKIKGNATRQDPIKLDDSDDERANFYRPKITLPEPVRRGQIRIVTGRHQSPVYEPSRNDKPAYADRRHGSFTPINDAYRYDAVKQPYQEYRDQGRANWRAINGPDYGHEDLADNNYRPDERRSRSPPYRDHKGYAGESSWPPPRPAPRAEQQDRRPRADANVYRPMPSAAQNAWIRRRL